jgi:ABC-2 type transport system ATP-binding protein
VAAGGLEITGLTKAYGGRRVLDGVSFEVGAGEVVGLLGPNGAGKTTLVSIVAGLRRADAGRVRALGVDATADPAALRPRLGLAGQDVGIYPVHTVAENLRLFGRLGGLRGGELTRSVTDLAEALELTPLLGRRAGRLSGGQQRRLHTACALVHRPELVLLDEPTVGADPESRLRLLRLVRELAAGGATVLYTTHYLGEIEDLDARVVILAGGRVRAEGSVAELVARHTRQEVVLRFAGEPPELDWPGARRAGSALHLPAAEPAVELVRAMDLLGPQRAGLTGIELGRAGLEQAYLAILGSAGLTADGTGPDRGPHPDRGPALTEAGA